MIEYLPIALVAGSGLLAWGRMDARVKAHDTALDTKASKDTYEQVDARLGRMEAQLDRLVERDVKKD